MSEKRELFRENEQRFAEIATKILQKDGFFRIPVKKTWGEKSSPELLMKKGENTYCVAFRQSRTQLFTSRSAVSAVEDLLKHTEKNDWLPLLVVGGKAPSTLRGELLNLCIRTILIDIENLLYMAEADRELYDELVAMLPYSTENITPREPDLLPMPDWNAAYGEKENWRVSTAADIDRSPSLVIRPVEKGGDKGDLIDGWDADWGDGWDRGDDTILDLGGDAMAAVSARDTVPTPIDLGDACIDLTDIGRDPWQEKSDPRGHMHGNPGTGKSNFLVQDRLQVRKPCSTKDLQEEIRKWQGGRGNSSSTQYEQLCTRSLRRLFADDLTLWREQAQSDAGLFRFDLICKIKQDNHKDFWEMAERYFGSKYIIFEFKNYTGQVTQREVFTTVRYLYTKALRGIAILVSPNGNDEHADQYIRGVLRDEGKLVLSLTNEELIHMLKMKEDGEDPADYLGDKLDELLIDLEK